MIIIPSSLYCESIIPRKVIRKSISPFPSHISPSSGAGGMPVGNVLVRRVCSRAIFEDVCKQKVEKLIAAGAKEVAELQEFAHK